MTLDVVSLLGPTASGKSSFGIQLAIELSKAGVPTEIVNADAMQLYRYLDIGTAKVPFAERQGVVHHLIDVLNPAEEYTANQYQQAFDEIIAKLHSQGKLPLLVGGSMFYISSALDQMDFSATDSKLRVELEQRVASEGIQFVIDQLAEVDPDSLAHIPSGNKRRLVRALEVNLLTGQPYRHSLPAPRFRRRTMQFGLLVDRETLVNRIDQRVLDMWQEGLLQEVADLESRQIRLGRTAAVAIGYQQAISQLAGKITESQAISETQQLTRRYARRQMSWFRRDTRTNWLQDPDPSEVARQIRLSL